MTAKIGDTATALNPAHLSEIRFRGREMGAGSDTVMICKLVNEVTAKNLPD